MRNEQNLHLTNYDWNEIISICHEYHYLSEFIGWSQSDKKQ